MLSDVMTLAGLLDAERSLLRAPPAQRQKVRQYFPLYGYFYHSIILFRDGERFAAQEVVFNWVSGNSLISSC
jgi:hypothetical protein